MNLYIMSRGRAGKVNTLKWIPEEWRDRTYLIVSDGESDDYSRAHSVPVIEAPSYVTNYSQKFQWILDGLPIDGISHADEKAVILDDDLVFSRRSPHSMTSLLTMQDRKEMEGRFEYMEHLLDEFALVGVHPRQMGQNTEPPYVNNGRIICIQGINRSKIGQVKVDQFPILADVVLNLTLLARGEPNAIITTFFQDHGPCQAPGGCSIYRTPEMQRAAVAYLANRFPGFVKVVEKKPKVAKWMGDTRYDYTAYWKRLYAAGMDYRNGLRRSPDTETSVPYAATLTDGGIV